MQKKTKQTSTTASSVLSLTVVHGLSLVGTVPQSTETGNDVGLAVLH